MSRVFLPIFFVVYWIASAGVLWWSYSISAQITGGYHERHQAFVLVTKMGLVVTVLTSFVWSFMMRREGSTHTGKAALTVLWQTALVIAGYAVLVLGWRQFSGTPAPDSAFLPILGSLNSHFFSEAGGFAFLLDVAPVMACVSGVLYFVGCRATRLRKDSLA